MCVCVGGGGNLKVGQMVLCFSQTQHLTKSKWYDCFAGNDVYTNIMCTQCRPCGEFPLKYNCIIEDKCMPCMQYNYKNGDCGLYCHQGRVPVRKFPKTRVDTKIFGRQKIWDSWETLSKHLIVGQVAPRNVRNVCLSVYQCWCFWYHYNKL